MAQAREAGFGLRFGCFHFLLILFTLTIKGMINGVSLSEIRAVQQTHRSHFHRLKKILTKSPAPQSDPQMAQVVRSRRQNHQQWRRFKQDREAEQLGRQNEAYQKKLERIRMGSSVYRCGRGSFNSSIAHNFYNRKKMEMRIEVENPEIGKRLVRMQPSISTAKTQQEYGKMKEIMARLQKFPVIDRLSSFSHKTRPFKTEGDTVSFSALPVSTARNRSVPPRPRPIPTGKSPSLRANF